MDKVLNFLQELSANNNREWFNNNRNRYIESRDKIIFLIEILINEIKIFDQEVAGVNPKDCMYRIFRDVRFSKDKSPYKTNFGGFIARGGRKSIYPGYFFHVEAEKSFVGGGVYMPQPGPLKAIRNYIAEEAPGFLEIINEPEFKKFYPAMYDHQLKSAPRGFPKDHPYIDLLRYKSFVFVHTTNNDKNFGKNFIEQTVLAYRQLYNINIFLREAMENNYNK